VTVCAPSAPPGSAESPEQILDRSGSNFRTGIVCLGRQRRTGLGAVYAFCRVADDAVDEAPDVATGRAHLAFWRGELAAAAAGRATTPIGQALGAAMVRFQVPIEPLTALLDGCAMDLEPRTYADEAALRVYCDRVAAAVGRACLPVFGAAGPDAVRYADALGQALQFTNILRDLRGDAAIGRVYAPQSWLGECGVDPAWLLGTGPAAAYAEGGPLALLAARFVATAQSEFARARAALLALPPRTARSLASARIMGAVYQDLLHRLARRGGELRAAEVRVPKAKKLWLAALVLLGVRA
jgi:phytoene synthase